MVTLWVRNSKNNIPSPFSENFNIISTTNDKKMNKKIDFDLDDPLADILSTGSNDSFFNDDIESKKPPQSVTSVVIDRKKSLFNLNAAEQEKVVNFDLEKKEETNSHIKVLNSDKSNIHVQPTYDNEPHKIIEISSVKQLNKSSIDNSKNYDNNLILDNLGDQKQTKDNKHPIDLIDDILGKNEKFLGSKPVTPLFIPKEEISRKSDEFLKNKIVKMLPNSKELINETRDIIKGSKHNLPTHSSDDPQPRRRSNLDWLGVVPDEEELNRNSPDDVGLPDWLMGGDRKKEKGYTIKKKITQDIEVKDSFEAPGHVNTQPQSPKQNLVSNLGLLGTQTNYLAQENPLSRSIGIDAVKEGVELFMQQQDTQLHIALQLKAQEEKLAALQERQEENRKYQQEALLAQRSQVQSMLEQQVSQRKQVQQVILQSQQRLGIKIRDLLDQKPIDDENQLGGIKEATDPVLNETHTSESKQLLQLIQTLQENHNREMDLMEISYRRQLTVADISIIEMEERYKRDSAKLIFFFEERLKIQNEQQNVFQKWYAEKIKVLTNEHEANMKDLNDQHTESLKTLQAHHDRLLQNIRATAIQEQDLINDSTNYSRLLKDIASDVQTNNAQTKCLMEKLIEVKKEQDLELQKKQQEREMLMSNMMENLRIEKDLFYEDRKSQNETMKLLENRLRSHSLILEEESHSIKQRRLEFEFEKATFQKQTEFAKSVLEKQKEELKMLKETMEKENLAKLAKILDQQKETDINKNKIQIEKRTIEELKVEAERVQFDLKRQLEQVSEDKSKLSDYKQRLDTEELQIISRCKDLETLSKVAVEKQAEAEMKRREAETLQRKYEDRIKRIQDQVISLNNREKQIAREKVALSRERIQLYNDKKEMEIRQQCSLCSACPPNARNQTMPSHNTLADNFVSRDLSDIPYDPQLHDVMLRNHYEQENRAADVGSYVLENQSRRQFNPPEPQSSSQGIPDPRLMLLKFDVQQVINKLSNKTAVKSNDNIMEES